MYNVYKDPKGKKASTNISTSVTSKRKEAPSKRKEAPSKRKEAPSNNNMHTMNTIEEQPTKEKQPDNI